MDTESADGRLARRGKTVRHIVLVSPDEPFRLELRQALLSAGLAVSLHPDLRLSRDEIARMPPDLVLLNLVCVSEQRSVALLRLRQVVDVPLVAIADRNDQAEEIECLRAGAADYLKRPVVIPLLVERVKARLRDGHGLAHMPDDPVGLRHGELSMDAKRHQVTWRGEPVTLTQTEFLLLQALALRPGHVKTRAQLLDVAYRDQLSVEDRTIDSHIKRLRMKIRRVDPAFSAIETLYGIGYRYAENNAP